MTKKETQGQTGVNLSMLLTEVNLVAGTGSDIGTDIRGYLRRFATAGFLHSSHIRHLTIVHNYYLYLMTKILSTFNTFVQMH